MRLRCRSSPSARRRDSRRRRSDDSSSGTRQSWSGCSRRKERDGKRMAPFFRKMPVGGIAKDARCPVCAGTVFYRVPLGRADTWYRQLTEKPQWKRFRGLPENAGVAFSEPRLEWDQPTFDVAETFTQHVRCGTCASLVPPQFLGEPKARVLLITTGMPQAGKTTW